MPGRRGLGKPTGLRRYPRKARCWATVTDIVDGVAEGRIRCIVFPPNPATGRGWFEGKFRIQSVATSKSEFSGGVAVEPITFLLALRRAGLWPYGVSHLDRDRWMIGWRCGRPAAVAASAGGDPFRRRTVSEVEFARLEWNELDLIAKGYLH